MYIFKRKGHTDIVLIRLRGGNQYAELRCTVQTCVHNYQYLCELDKIQVGGNSAKDAKETCCDSFEERREGSYSNKTDSMKSVFRLLRC